MISIGFQASSTQEGLPQIDGSVAIFLEGKVYSLPQQYLTGQKHDGNVEVALSALLSAFGLRIGDVDHFVVSTCGEAVPPSGSPVYIRTDRRLTLQDMGVPEEKILWMKSHHKSHAYEALLSLESVYGDDVSFCETWAILVADRVGQPDEHQSVFLVEDRKLRLVWRGAVSNGNCPGLAWGYDLVTEHLGFKSGTEAGKITALAGQARKGPSEQMFCIEQGVCSTTLPRDQASADTFLENRWPAAINSRGQTESGRLLARAIQDSLEVSFCQLLQWLKLSHSFSGVVVGGGVGQNCKLVARISSELDLKCLGSVCPGDTGQGIGNVTSWALKNRQSGKLIDGIELCFLKKDWLGAFLPDGDLSDVNSVADFIANGGVVIASGNSIEPGPRALGFNSILADGRREYLREQVSECLKGRLAFQPLGAMISEKLAVKLGLGNLPALFMDAVAFLDQDNLNSYPAVVHSDNSVRIQRIGGLTEETGIADLVRALEERHGIQMTINTSLNLAGEPLDIFPLHQTYLARATSDMEIKLWCY